MSAAGHMDSLSVEPKDILLVEDNPDDAELTMIALDRHNVSNRVVLATDGAQALDLLLGERAATYVVVMLDLKLPKISGLDLLKRLRADPRTRTLPVVILTSSSQQEDMLESYELGANSFVRKPVEFGAFVEAISTLGLFWAVVNEVPTAASQPDAIPRRP